MAPLDLHLVCRLRAFAVDLSLELGDEVVALAGPSGAGKTTVLRSVAGLHRPDAGRIACGGETWFERRDGLNAVVDLPAERRSVGYVPQHHALFPHLTVARNVAFGGAAPAEVDALLARLGIAHLAGERPMRLSGGERQRAALARALARRPRVLLLDEPLAALDAHTRRSVRDQLAGELREAGIPTLLVTHDVGDAMALASRIAVMVDGTLRQLGTPQELHEAPADRFVVALTGGSVLSGVARDGHVDLGGGALVAAQAPPGEVEVGLYPWDVDVQPGPGPDGALRGIVAATALHGGRLRVRVDGWVGEASELTGLEPGAPAHGLVRRVHVLPR